MLLLPRLMEGDEVHIDEPDGQHCREEHTYLLS